MQLTLTIPSLNQTSRLTDALRGLYHKHRVFCFHGELGAGKTAFIKSICKDLGVEHSMSSPSFSLVNEYDSKEEGILYHLDLYRLKTPDELLDIGWEDYLDSGALLFIEWPEKGGVYIPNDAIHIQIKPDHSTEVRSVTITD